MKLLQSTIHKCSELLGFVLLSISVVNQLSGVQQGQAALALANKYRDTERERHTKTKQELFFSHICDKNNNVLIFTCDSEEMNLRTMILQH